MMLFGHRRQIFVQLVCAPPISKCLFSSLAANKLAFTALFIQQQQRRMASLLVQNHSKYGFLRDLGLQDENSGVFDGREWRGEGPVIESLSPATNEVICSGCELGPSKTTTVLPKRLNKLIENGPRCQLRNEARLSVKLVISYASIWTTWELWWVCVWTFWMIWFRCHSKWARFFQRASARFKNTWTFVTMLLVCLESFPVKWSRLNVPIMRCLNSGTHSESLAWLAAFQFPVCCLRLEQCVGSCLWWHCFVEACSVDSVDCNRYHPSHRTGKWTYRRLTLF